MATLLLCTIAGDLDGCARLLATVHYSPAIDTALDEAQVAVQLLEHVQGDLQETALYIVRQLAGQARAGQPVQPVAPEPEAQEESNQDADNNPL